MLHDTYAELVPGHLLGPMLATVGLVAGLVHRVRARGLLPWIGMALCALLIGFGAGRSAEGFAALGVAGMPRRYLEHSFGAATDECRVTGALTGDG